MISETFLSFWLHSPELVLYQEFSGYCAVMTWNFALFVVQIVEDVSGWLKADESSLEFCHL